MPFVKRHFLEFVHVGDSKETYQERDVLSELLFSILNPWLFYAFVAAPFFNYIFIA